MGYQPHGTCVPVCFQRNLVTYAKARPAQMIFITTSHVMWRYSVPNVHNKTCLQQASQSLMLLSFKGYFHDSYAMGTCLYRLTRSRVYTWLVQCLPGHLLLWAWGRHLYLCHPVDFVVVNIEANIAVFLLNQDYRDWMKVELLPAPASCLSPSSLCLSSPEGLGRGAI